VSASGFAAVLTQQREGRIVMIDAASRTTTPAEKNYYSSKLECSCTIWIVKKWKHYLYAAPHTTIVTHSYCLQFLQEEGDKFALAQRWLCETEGFNYVDIIFAAFIPRYAIIAAPLTQLLHKDCPKIYVVQAM